MIAALGLFVVVHLLAAYWLVVRPGRELKGSQELLAMFVECFLFGVVMEAAYDLCRRRRITPPRVLRNALIAWRDQRRIVP